MASVTTTFKAAADKMTKIGRALYDVTVMKDLENEFNRIGPRMVSDAQKSMRNTPRAAYFYNRGTAKRPRKHFPSQPGNPPAVDRGDLWKNIRFDAKRLSDNFQFQIGTDQKHGFFLENGTKNMAERPWLFPMVRKFEPQIYDMIKRITGAELRDAFRKGGAMQG